MRKIDLTDKKCLVPVSDRFAKSSREALKPCGRAAIMVGRWPKRVVDGQAETVLIALCGTCGAQNAAAKWDAAAPYHCYTDDEIALLAKSGLYVEKGGVSKNKLDTAVGLVRYKAEIAINSVKKMLARATQ